MISLLAFLLLADFRFVILGDRTGDTRSGVYEEVWKETAADHPAFVINAGDTIQGGDDASADREWRSVKRILAPYSAIPFYLTPGNHDIWSELSERLFAKYAGRQPHYSFDREQVHFTILDNSRDEEFSAAELAFLEADLEAHKSQPLKFIVSHRPSWLVRILLRNPQDPVHLLAKKYGVQYVISGHVHLMIHASFEGVEYFSMPSAGGHLRGTEKYEDGWFFAHTLVEVDNAGTHFHIKEIKPAARVTTPADWGPSGLLHH